MSGWDDGSEITSPNRDRNHVTQRRFEPRAPHRAAAVRAREPKRLYISAAIGILGVALLGASPHSEVNEISRALDRLYRSNSSHGELEMQVRTPDYERSLDMEMWTRGMDDTLVRIRSPKKERGTSTLKKGREMWNFLPKIKKTIRVPPSMMMSSWMGSDFTNDDMVRESSWQDDYDAKLTKDAPANQKCLDYRAKADAAVAWDRVVVCVHSKDFYPIREEFYDEKGRKARLMEFSEVREIAGRKVPMRMTLTPLTADKKGNRTVIKYKTLEFDVSVADSMFTLSTLKRGH